MATTVWLDKEVFELINVWKQKSIQAMLKASLRNIQVFEIISTKMKLKGYHKSPVQCREKLKKLKVEWKKIRNFQGTEMPKFWRFYDAMDQAMNYLNPVQHLNVCETVINGHEEDHEEDINGASHFLSLEMKSELSDNDIRDDSRITILEIDREIEGDSEKASTSSHQSDIPDTSKKAKKRDSTTTTPVDIFMESQMKMRRDMLEFFDRQEEREMQMRMREMQHERQLFRILAGMMESVAKNSHNDN